MRLGICNFRVQGYSNEWSALQSSLFVTNIAFATGFTHIDAMQQSQGRQGLIQKYHVITFDALTTSLRSIGNPIKCEPSSVHQNLNIRTSIRTSFQTLLRTICHTTFRIVFVKYSNTWYQEQFKSQESVIEQPASNCFNTSLDVGCRYPSFNFLHPRHDPLNSLIVCS